MSLYFFSACLSNKSQSKKNHSRKETKAFVTISFTKTATVFFSTKVKLLLNSSQVISKKCLILNIGISILNFKFALTSVLKSISSSSNLKFFQFQSSFSYIKKFKRSKLSLCSFKKLTATLCQLKNSSTKDSENI